MDTPPVTPKEAASDKVQSALKGIAFMLASTLLAAVMNSAARHVSQTVHPFELVFFRNLFAFAFVLPMLWRVGFGALRTNRPWMHAGRAGLNVVNMMVWFTAISLAPLAEVVALGFTGPIFATILGVLIVKEVVGVRRWSAIIVGFIGTLVVLQPGFDTVQTGHGLALMAAFMWAGVLLIIKSLSRTESSITIVAYMSILMTPLSLIPALFVWVWPTWTELGWLALIGVCGGAAQYLLSQSFHEADISVVMPFDFAKLVWIALIAYIAFAEVPTLTTWIGGAIIFASGLYIARRESIKNREKRRE
ncbi:DMT family transporter [Thalassospiraceae bacterium LMO-JJ14]|nr:DMT family transporter [Thalassospiraceae bacterium LMO-JJ14]